MRLTITLLILWAAAALALISSTKVDDASETSSTHSYMGTPPPGYQQEWVTHSVYVHGFASLSALPGEFEYVYLPEFTLLENHYWCLSIYPGGNKDATKGMVSLYLENRSNKAIEIDFGFSVIDSNGKQVEHKTDGPRNFTPMGDDNSGWGWPNFAKHSNLMSSLIYGTLVIEVHMKLATPTKLVPPPFIPENPAAKMTQGLFLNNKSTDIVFEVGGEEQLKNDAESMILVTFPAHRVIVENCSSIFPDLCESHNNSAISHIQINYVKPDVFHLLLGYIYGLKISDDDMKSHTREIIDAAYKYKVVNLKLEAEAYFVQTTTFTMENVMELLLYAELKKCALLKEAAMDYIVKNKADIIKQLSFTDDSGSLLYDVLVALFRSENEDGTVGDIESQLASMRVSQLRKKAHDMGLGVDGSREMLIADIKESLEKVHGY
jgi:hypothetical protein